MIQACKMFISVATLSRLSRGMVFLWVMALVACSKPEPSPEPVRAVRVLQVGSNSLNAQLEFAGEVRARIESRLGFRVAGKITRRWVDNGQRVKAGQLLAELDPQDFVLAMESAQAQLQSAKTQRDLAAADLKRYKDLLDQRFISRAEYERRDATFQAAQAQLDTAQAQLSSQRNQTQYTQLRADANGIVTAIDAEPGQVVAAGASMVRLALDGERDAVFAIPEDKLSMWRVGQEVTVQFWGTAQTVKGRVREMAGSADALTRTFAVKVALPDGQLPLGTTVTVWVKSEPSDRHAKVIKLPTSALRQEGGETAVWVLDEQTMSVRSQVVHIQTTDGNEVVIGAGLTPGQQVVIAGVHVLSPGQKVSLYQHKDTSATPQLPPVAASR
jgi:RND family efflux transporter MFP subunit